MIGRRFHRGEHGRAGVQFGPKLEVLGARQRKAKLDEQQATPQEPIHRAAGCRG
jgi:hypothetical protein